MFKDIVKDIKKIDVLVSTHVVIENGKLSSFDTGMQFVYNNGHQISQYFDLSLDTVEFDYHYRLLYDIDHDVDFVFDEKRWKISKGYTQYRRATQAERMLFFSLVNYNKGFMRQLALHYDCDIPYSLLDGEYCADDDPLVITFPDYVAVND